MTWKKAFIVDLTMNALSTLGGAFALPAAGFIWEFFPGSIYMKMLNMGTFNPITWAATCAMATFISTCVEAAVVRYVFSYGVTKRRFWCVALANLTSTTVAFFSLMIDPSKL